MSQFFSSGGQSIGVSDSASVLPVNIQDWFPLGWTGWISLQSKGLSRVFSNTTVQKHHSFWGLIDIPLHVSIASSLSVHLFSVWYSPTRLLCFCCLCFLCQIQKQNHFQHQHQRVYCLRSLLYGFRSYIKVFNWFWVSFCVWWKIVVQFHSPACGCPVFPTFFI